MKRMTTILTLLTVLFGLSLSVNAQQKWDFTNLTDADKALLDADNNWYNDTNEKNLRYNYLPALDNEALMANGQELAYAKGLKFKAGEATASSSGTPANQNGKIRIAYGKKCMNLNGNKIVVTVPGLKAGLKLSVEFQTSNNSTARCFAATNLKNTEGFTDTTDKVMATGIVEADGDVTLTTNGGLYVYSIEVSEVSEDDNLSEYAVPSNLKVNQAILTLKDQTSKYYNTADIDDINFTDEGVRVTPTGIDGFDLYKNVQTISFRKGEGGSDPVVVGELKITEAKGWLESAYVKFDKMEGAKSYNVYVKGGQYNEYTKIDRELVREYANYGRADVVGLMAGNYDIKVVPVDAEGKELADKAGEATGLEVKNYSRAGFAFMNGYAPGAYNLDGTLKANAKVFYVTKNTAKTITTTVAGAEVNPCVGIQQIIEGYEKGGDTTPIAFRFIGLVEAGDIDFFGSKEEGIQVKGRKADSELNMTFEGIGDDATLRGFGFLVRNSKSVEFRNLGIMRCMDDGISMDTDNSNIWVHHCDFFYGKHGSGDHDKGDGQVDVKADSKLVTVSYNRFWDTGKTNMFGMKSESGPNYISYDHNWFDHSDSRHPRVRTMSVHVWNNYFDNVAKYGVGSCTGASVFVENNYFLKTKKPILSSNQGTDALGSGTFSGEDGGMIKAYGNYFDRSAVNFRYFTQKNPDATTGYDAYETDSRDEQVPATEVTRAGGTSYNNFDTNASVMYGYTVDAAADVPGIVKGYYGAGRLNHGDFTYTFTDNVGNDDTDSAYDATLGGLLDNYKSQLLGIFGDDNSQPGGGDEPGPVDPEPQEGTILASFDGAPSNSMFTVGGDYGDGKITYEGTYYKKGVKLNSKGSITFTPQKNYQMTVVLATGKPGRAIKLNGETANVTGTENTEGNYYELQPIAISEGQEYVITQSDGESIVMLIKLEPTEE